MEHMMADIVDSNGAGIRRTIESPLYDRLRILQ